MASQVVSIDRVFSTAAVWLSSWARKVESTSVGGGCSMRSLKKKKGASVMGARIPRAYYSGKG